MATTRITANRPIIIAGSGARHAMHPVDLPVRGEIRLTARRLSETLDGAQGEGLISGIVFAQLSEAVPRDPIIAVDVGNNNYSSGCYFESKGHRILMSAYLGSIGFSFPAAMGVWAATQDQQKYRRRQLVAVSGDGGFGQYMGDLNTAVNYGMNSTHVLPNNSQLGEISKEQRAGEWPFLQTSLHNPSFAAFAILCGAHCIRVTKPEKRRAALDAALTHEGTALIEIITDAELIESRNELHQSCYRQRCTLASIGRIMHTSG